VTRPNKRSFKKNSYEFHIPFVNLVTLHTANKMQAVKKLGRGAASGMARLTGKATLRDKVAELNTQITTLQVDLVNLKEEGKVSKAAETKLKQELEDALAAYTELLAHTQLVGTERQNTLNTLHEALAVGQLVHGENQNALNQLQEDSVQAQLIHDERVAELQGSLAQARAQVR
jgi:vacuolar-type H+-ATPase subunit I/STV1